MSLANFAEHHHLQCPYALHRVRHLCHRRRLKTVTRARTSKYSEGKTRARTYERVLRYPGGKVRRIRYPSVDEDDFERWNTASSYEEDWDPDRWSAHDTWSEASTSQRIPPLPPQQPQGIPDTAGELVRVLSSEQYKKAQHDEWSRLQAMYQVLETSPWVQSRAMQVLAMVAPNSDTALTYTLRTRVQRPNFSRDMDKLLGQRKAPDGGSFWKAEELRDGIIALEDEADALRLAELVQAECPSDMQVVPVAIDAHSLFRQAQAVRAVIVWIARGNEGVPPAPAMLAASLRRQKPVEEQLDD